MLDEHGIPDVVSILQGYVLATFSPDNRSYWGYRKREGERACATPVGVERRHRLHSCNLNGKTDSRHDRADPVFFPPQGKVVAPGMTAFAAVVGG